MTKTIFKAVSVAVLATVITGCMGSKAPEKPAEPDFRCKQDGQLAPKWTCNPYLEGSIVALGIAQKNAGNDQGMQRSEAVAEARDALANQLSVKVSTMFKSYKATTGSGTDATFDKSNSKVSKQLASQTLQGSRAVEMWKSNAGTMYVLVGLSNEPVKKQMEKSIKTSFKNDKAMYQKFLAAKADGELDAELEKAAE
ncbi:MAG: LPP20 family lipoprotein [Campylobacterota bacterium]|nr:LPP20 family lipoprotein [Campylobacterota bacterium]